MLQRSLIGVAFVGCTICIGGLSAYITAEPEIEQSLRRDLLLKAGTDLWIEEVDLVSDPNLVVAVSRSTGYYKMFAAIRHGGSPLDHVQEKWQVLGEAGSGAPEGEPEAVWEYIEYFDTYPSGRSIDQYWDQLNSSF